MQWNHQNESQMQLTNGWQVFTAQADFTILLVAPLKGVPAFLLAKLSVQSFEIGL